MFPGHVRARRIRLAALAACLAACVALAGCAASGTDIHLEPLWSRHTMASGGTEVEALGGLYLSQNPMPGLDARIHGVRPLWSQRNDADGDRTSHFLVPLGFDRKSGTGHTTMLLPLFYYQSRVEEPQHEGLPGKSRFDLVALPGLLLSRSDKGTDRIALFPLGGMVDHLFTYDKIRFVLFPLFLYTERERVRSWHVLWPIFGWSRGPESSSQRLWPLVGHSQRDGRYDRWFWLWPFLHWHRERDPGTENLSATKFLFFPLYGRTRIGTYRSTTVLWPFFGYARDPRRGYWAVDAPWPFVRMQGGGLDPNAEERRRAWPFYSHFRSAGLHADATLWPFFHRRREDYAESERDSTYLVPFWQSWDRTSKVDGSKSSWRKLWPLYQHYQQDEYVRYAFPDLNPFWRSEMIEFHYAWIWELYVGERGRFGERERLWGGLYRAESTRLESRHSLSALYASRAYSDERGEVIERSLLFGLLRFRTSSRDGFDPMRPAFPGPGWPAAMSGAMPGVDAEAGAQP
ncbi:MAG: hypothetical protein EPO68_10670 [Planctomycetota bacterium]|nr:MAG: hypothetical protein EPO68_10670 [Planctomycetota bacterium]